MSDAKMITVENINVPGHTSNVNAEKYTACVKVVYFTRNAEGEVVLLTLYAKSKTDNLTGPKLKEIRRVLEE